MQKNIENCSLDERLNAIKSELKDPDERPGEAPSTIRKRRPALNGENLKDKDDKTPKKLVDKNFLKIFGTLAICLIILLFVVIKMRFQQEISQNKGFIFENIVKLVDTGSEELSSLEIPETSEMSSYRVNIRDLGIKMEKSDIIVKNGKRISEVLFGLDKEIQVTGDELEEFRHQAKGFLFSLASEMKAITQEIEKSQWLEYGFFKYIIKSNSHSLSDSSVDFICKRLRVLEKQIPGFQEQLKKVITTIYSVRDSADNTHGYLIDGEREAENFLKQYWLGNIADHVTRKRTEDELLRVRTIIKMLKEIAPNLIKFESFLKEYRRHIQDVAKEVKNSPTTAEDLKYLKQAVIDLEKHHSRFSLAAEKQSKSKSLDDFNVKYLNEKQNLDEEEIKFSSEEYKPIDTNEDAEE
ncbi:2870_t:CDS:2, partial [Racocetra persica]